MSDENFDWKQQAANFVAVNFEKILSHAKNFYNVGDSKIRARLEATYGSYLERIWKTYSRAQSFFVREPTYLYDFYVALPIQIGKRRTGGSVQRISSPSVLDCFAKNNSVILTGSGGSGKSMFVRHLVLDCLLKGYGIPVFIELRTNAAEFPANLEDRIFEFISNLDYNINHAIFIELLLLGNFVIFLDGFDELSEDVQDAASSSIQRFSKLFPKVKLLVSSRPESHFTGWHGFGHSEMAPLNLEEAIAFSDAQKFDHDIVELFKRELNNGAFEKHESFLSNPLLLTIMLLTYGQNASIPSKLSEFYENAFEALFQRHDVLKGGYQRPRACLIDYADFGRVFSAFCLHSYYDKKVSFSNAELIDYAEKSQTTSQLQFSKEAFIKDCVKAVCLLVDEGLKTVFAHRSFQEYFVARFISKCEPEIAAKLLRNIEPRIGMDRVHDLTYEMNPTLVEVHFIIPRLKELRAELKIKHKVGIAAFWRYIKRNYDGINFESQRITYSCNMSGNRHFQDHYFMMFTFRCCLQMPHKLSKRFRQKYESEEKRTRFPVDSLSIKNEFVKDLFAEENFLFSKAGLELLFALPEKLELKHQKKLDSLEDIINKKLTRNFPPSK